MGFPNNLTGGTSASRLIFDEKGKTKKAAISITKQNLALSRNDELIVVQDIYEPPFSIGFEVEPDRRSGFNTISGHSYGFNVVVGDYLICLLCF